MASLCCLVVDQRCKYSWSFPGIVLSVGVISAAKVDPVVALVKDIIKGTEYIIKK